MITDEEYLTRAREMLLDRALAEDILGDEPYKFRCVTDTNIVDVNKDGMFIQNWMFHVQHLAICTDEIKIQWMKDHEIY